jgi:hypothetical protein
MRIYQSEGSWKLRFSLAWEEQRLTELGDNWVAFSLPGDTYTIGRLHARSREIIFFQAVEISPLNSQLVVLDFPEDTQYVVAETLNESEFSESTTNDEASEILL